MPLLFSLMNTIICKQEHVFPTALLFSQKAKVQLVVNQVIVVNQGRVEGSCNERPTIS